MDNDRRKRRESGGPLEERGFIEHNKATHEDEELHESEVETTDGKASAVTDA